LPPGAVEVVARDGGAASLVGRVLRGIVRALLFAFVVGFVVGTAIRCALERPADAPLPYLG